VPKRRSTVKANAWVPGRRAAGVRVNASVRERPARTADTASAVLANKRARAGEGEEGEEGAFTQGV
jgi:hypothetical protein